MFHKHSLAGTCGIPVEEIDVCIAKQRKTVWWENGRWFVAKGSGMAATAI